MNPAHNNNNNFMMVPPPAPRKQQQQRTYAFENSDTPRARRDLLPDFNVAAQPQMLGTMLWFLNGAGSGAGVLPGGQ